MKLKNKTDSVREIRNRYGLISLVGPGEIIEIEKPIINNSVLNAFKIIKSGEIRIKKNVKRKKGIKTKNKINFEYQRKFEETKKEEIN